MHRGCKVVMKAVAVVVGIVVLASLTAAAAWFVLTVFVFRPLLSVLMFFLGVMSL